jgi:hypothetical protein
MQNLTESELAEMPFGNLAETVHNKWLQQSDNRGNDLYVSTVDDFVRAFIQVYMYYQYLKGEHVGTCLGKEELMLWIAQHLAQRFGNPKTLNVAIAKMPGVEEFCIQEPHFEMSKCLALRSAKRIYPLDLNTSHIGLIELTSLVHESVQGPLELGVLVAV